MRPFDPEPPIEPREPEVWDTCILCDGEIYKGKRYFKAQNGNVCHFCGDQLHFREEIAGEDSNGF